jgi:hypothetical protein
MRCTPRPFVSPRIPFLLGLLACALVGCDSGEYNRRFADSLNQQVVGPGTRGGAGGGGGALLYSDPIALTTTPPPDLKICLPLIFNDQSTVLTSESPGAGRAQPPFLILPGFQYSRERMLDGDDGKKLPCYFYVAVQGTAANSSRDIRNNIQQQLEGKLTVSHKEENLTGPHGESINWLRLSCTGNQEFDGSDEGGSKETLPGRFLVFLVATPKHEVIVGWRAASSVADKHQFFQAVDRAMETLQGSGLPQRAS